MNFSLTDEQLAVRKMAREFAEKEIVPRVREDEREHRFQRDLIAKMADLGFFGSAFPPEYGGTGLGFLVHAILCEEVSRAHSSLRSLFNMQALTCPLTIYNWGTQEQKRKYVKRLVTCELFGAFALTEPNCGSDVAAMQTTAVRDGDAYVLNGTKMWITHASVFDVAVIFAKTRPDQGHKGISGFIVERSFPGITGRDIEDKLGHHCSPTGEIVLHDVRVPVENLLGEENHGFYVAMNALDYGRLSVASGALGVAQACLDASVQYANQRHAFGHPIGYYQMVQSKIAEMAAEIDAARLLVYRSGYLKDQGARDTLESTTAKYFASEVAVKAANYAVEIHGGYGYCDEFPVARYYRDAKLYQIGEGAANITKAIIALDALGWKKANR